MSRKCQHPDCQCIGNSWPCGGCNTRDICTGGHAPAYSSQPACHGTIAPRGCYAHHTTSRASTIACVPAIGLTLSQSSHQHLTVQSLHACCVLPNLTAMPGFTQPASTTHTHTVTQHTTHHQPITLTKSICSCLGLFAGGGWRSRLVTQLNQLKPPWLAAHYDSPVLNLRAHGVRILHPHVYRDAAACKVTLRS